MKQYFDQLCKETDLQVFANLTWNRRIYQSWFLEAWPTFYFIDDTMVVQEYMRGFSSAGVKANIEKITQ